MIKRSISMPVKPPYIEETPHLERSEEKEELYLEDDESETSQPFLEEFNSPTRDSQSQGSSRDSVHDASEISETTPPSDKQNEQNEQNNAKEADAKKTSS